MHEDYAARDKYPSGHTSGVGYFMLVFGTRLACPDGEMRPRIFRLRHIRRRFVVYSILSCAC